MLIDPKVQARADAKRQEIVEEIVQKIDEMILAESDGTAWETNWLTLKVAIESTRWALAMTFDPTIDRDDVGCFELKIRKAMYDIVFKRPLKAAVIREWLVMQVAMRFVEKAAVPFADRLREHDRNN